VGHDDVDIVTTVTDVMINQQISRLVGDMIFYSINKFIAWARMSADSTDVGLDSR
jgi:hypothetical protein